MSKPDKMFTGFPAFGLGEKERHERLAQSRPPYAAGFDHGTFVWGEQDICRLQCAYRARFDEDVPRTETLFYVAAEGIRIFQEKRGMTKPDKNGWMLIESAPKDGTRVLLYSGPQHVGVGSYRSVSEWMEIDGRKTKAMGKPKWHGVGVHNPTHWKPIDYPEATE